jgi:hypothetical protein
MFDLGCSVTYTKRVRFNIVDIVKRLRAGRHMVRLPEEERYFVFFPNVHTSSGAHSASNLMDAGSVFRGTKQVGSEYDQTPPSSAAVRT